MIGQALLPGAVSVLPTESHIAGSVKGQYPVPARLRISVRGPLRSARCETGAEAPARVVYTYDAANRLVREARRRGEPEQHPRRRHHHVGARRPGAGARRSALK